MYIDKITIRNFKCFHETFSLKLNNGTNILVGCNDAGKSTILEAIHLALTGILNGRYLKNELSQYLFNKNAEQEYLKSLNTNKPLPPPDILIELYFGGEVSSEMANLQGNDNSNRLDCSGIIFRIEFDDHHKGEYEKLVQSGGIKNIPIEYYKATLKSFARDTSVTYRSIPIKSALIDSSSMRIQNGSDIYVSRFIKENLDESERVEISQAHRLMKETFINTPTVSTINSKINSTINISRKRVSISVDMATQHAWETSLLTYIDEIPFHYIGKGEQSIIKTALALGHKKSLEANVILIEEPENHLSHTKLNELIKRIKGANNEKQIIVSTHSSFVANKLGLDHLIFLNALKCIRLNELSKETNDFFYKLAGYDTLRLILCNKAILVEGDSDELIIQKAYINKHGNLPIEDGIDVISVGTSFLRFLEISEKINKPVAVVTDNDGNVQALESKYISYLGNNAKSFISISYDPNIDKGSLYDFNYNTLEPKLLKANNRNILNNIFETKYQNDEELLVYMNNNKTKCAFKIFESSTIITFPQYILNVL